MSITVLYAFENLSLKKMMFSLTTDLKLQTCQQKNTYLIREKEKKNKTTKTKYFSPVPSIYVTKKKSQLTHLVSLT